MICSDCGKYDALEWSQHGYCLRCWIKSDEPPPPEPPIAPTYRDENALLSDITKAFDYLNDIDLMRKEKREHYERKVSRRFGRS